MKGLIFIPRHPESALAFNRPADPGTGIISESVSQMTETSAGSIMQQLNDYYSSTLVIPPRK
jgi:hypothetical protein